MSNPDVGPAAAWAAWTSGRLTVGPCDVPRPLSYRWSRTGDPSGSKAQPRIRTLPSASSAKASTEYRGAWLVKFTSPQPSWLVLPGPARFSEKTQITCTP
jgi:hypothetical protein